MGNFEQKYCLPSTTRAMSLGHHPTGAALSLKTPDLSLSAIALWSFK